MPARQILLCLALLITAPLFAQKKNVIPDTIRVTFDCVVKSKKAILRVQNANEAFLIQLDGKREDALAEFFHMDIRKHDTLTIAGFRTTKKRTHKAPVFPKATILTKTNYVDHDDQLAYTNALDVKPSFNGGDANEFSHWVNSQLRYPPIEKERGYQGKVVLAFTIDGLGNVSDVEIKKSSGSQALDGEAFRVVSLSPTWEPGYIGDMPVPVRYTFPIIFQLKESE